jgi:hypothetical protein
LTIELLRELPEIMKPRKIEIGNVTKPASKPKVVDAANDETEAASSPASPAARLSPSPHAARRALITPRLCVRSLPGARRFCLGRPGSRQRSRAFERRFGEPGAFA